MINKNRFYKLMGKRKKLTADIFEEEELIELSKKMSDDELKNIDKNLLKMSNEDRLDKINEKLK